MGSIGLNACCVSLGSPVRKPAIINRNFHEDTSHLKAFQTDIIIRIIYQQKKRKQGTILYPDPSEQMHNDKRSFSFCD